jgi:CheY-like chemotaxis protein
MAVIVTAEDDIDVADMLTTTLSRAGHQVHTVGTGPRALQMVAQFHPDLVILDHAMPGMTGLDVARRLRADSMTATTPLLMFSAFAPEGAQDVFDRVMHKPMPLRRVAETAQDLLAAMTRPELTVARALTDRERLASVAALLGDPDPVDELGLALLVGNIAEAAGVHAAAAKLVLNDSVLMLASVGMPDIVIEAGGVPAEWTPSGVAAGMNRPVAVDDLWADPIFRDVPMATVCGFRSYASAPLHDDKGLVVGVLAVMDPEPGRLPADIIDLLRKAEPAAMNLINRRREATV